MEDLEVRPGPADERAPPALPARHRAPVASVIAIAEGAVLLLALLPAPAWGTLEGVALVVGIGAVLAGTWALTRASGRPWVLTCLVACPASAALVALGDHELSPLWALAFAIPSVVGLARPSGRNRLTPGP